jgi:hypothetical protein
VKLRFLQQLRDLMPLARERLAEAQGSYKRNYDRTVRPKNDIFPKDSWVYVCMEVHTAGANPKLDDQVEGLFQVALNDGHKLILRIGDELARVNSDRITPAPAPLVPSNNAQSPPVDGQELPLTEFAQEMNRNTSYNQLSVPENCGMVLYGTRFSGLAMRKMMIPGNQKNIYPKP